MARKRVTVQAAGATALNRRLEELPEHIRAGAEKAVDEALDAVEENMIETAPYRTGELVDSIEKSREGLAGTVGPTARHSFAVEQGTSTHEAQPFVFPAALEEQPKFAARFKEAVSEEIEKNI